MLKGSQKLIDEDFKHRIQIIGDGYDFENIKNLKQELGINRELQKCWALQTILILILKRQRFLHF